MQKECSVLCKNCGKFYDYFINNKSCPHCKKAADIDSKIEILVLVFNKIGFPTLASCQGHYNDWQWPFPWIAFCNNSHLQIPQSIIHRYNKSCKKEERWKITFNLSGKTYWLKPEQDYRPLDWLQKQAKNLAAYIETYLF